MAYKLYEDAKIGVWIESHLWVIPVIVITYVFGRLLVGYIDKKANIREYEIEEYNKTDPNIRKIHRDLAIIIKKLNDKGD